MICIYGMPTSGKSTFLSFGLKGCDTDVVRVACGLEKGVDDSKIFELTYSTATLLGCEVLVTNLIEQVIDHNSKFDQIYELQAADRTEAIKRLSTRDGISIDEASELWDSWTVKHSGEPRYVEGAIKLTSNECPEAKAMLKLYNVVDWRIWKSLYALVSFCIHTKLVHVLETIKSYLEEK